MATWTMVMVEPCSCAIKSTVIAVKQLDVVVQGSLGKINVKIQSVPHQFQSRA